MKHEIGSDESKLTGDYELRVLTTINHRLAICGGALMLQHRVKIHEFKDDEVIKERFEWETVPIAVLSDDGVELQMSKALISVDIGAHSDLFDSSMFPIVKDDK